MTGVSPERGMPDDAVDSGSGGAPVRHRWFAAAAALAVLAGSAAAAGGPGWQVSTTPNQGTEDGLQAVSARPLSPTAILC